MLSLVSPSEDMASPCTLVYADKIQSGSLQCMHVYILLTNGMGYQGTHLSSALVWHMQSQVEQGRAELS